MNPTEYANPDYAKTNLDIVKEQHPGMTDAQGRLIVNAQNHRDRVQERLAGKQEALEAKRGNLFRTYINQRAEAESAEEKESRQRREKKAQRWAAIADGVAALANIGGAMHGATPIQPSKTLSQAQAERMEHARKLRELEQKKLTDHNKRMFEMAKKDFDEAKKDYDNTVKSLAAAEKNITDREVQAMTLQNTDQNQKRADEKEEDMKRHRKVVENQGQQRITLAGAAQAENVRHHKTTEGIAAYSATHRSGGGGGGNSETQQATRWYNEGQRTRATNPELFNKWKNENRKNVRTSSDSDLLKAFGAAVESGYGRSSGSGGHSGGNRGSGGGGGNKPTGGGHKPTGGNKGGWAAGLNKGKKK